MDVALVFREYVRLDRMRAKGLTPEELHRFTLLKRKLNQHFSPGLPDAQADRRDSVRVPVRMRVAFEFTGEEGERTGFYLHAGARTFIELFAGRPEALPDAASYRHLCLEVDDIARSVAAVAAAGVEVSEPKTGSDGSLQAWLADPDGNRIELHQFLPDSKQTRALGEGG